MSLIEIITIVVSAVIVVSVFSVMIYRKLTGKSSCCDCEHCAMHGQCKKQKPNEKE